MFSAYSIRFWDVDAGKELLRPPGHNSSADAVAFSPSGKSVATVGDDATLCLWGATTGRNRWCVNEVKDGRHFLSLFFARGGRCVATNHDPVVFDLWDFATGEKTEQWPLRQAGLVLRSKPEGDYLPFWAINENREEMTAYRLDVAAGESIGPGVGPYFMPGPSFHPTPATRVIFSRDGLRAAVSDSWKRIDLLDLQTNEVLQTIEAARGTGREDTILDFALSPDGTVVASSWTSRHTHGIPEECKGVRLWDTASGRLLCQIDPKAFAMCPVWKLAFSPDGRILATLSGSVIGLWEVASGKSLGQFAEENNGCTWDFAFAPDGERLATPMNDGSTLIWDCKPSGWQPPKGKLTADDLTQLWQDLGDLNAEIAYHAVYTLAAAPEEAVPFLSERVKSVATWSSLRGVWALQRIGTPEARKSLSDLAAGVDEARLTREAKNALDWLDRRAKLPRE